MTRNQSPFMAPWAKISTWGNDHPEMHLLLQCSKLGSSEVKQVKARIERYGVCVVRREGSGFTTNSASVKELAPGKTELDPNLEFLQKSLGSISEEQSGTSAPTAKLIVSDHEADPLAGNTLGKLHPHVDGSHLRNQPSIIILQYLVTPDVGGALCFVDMAKVLELLFLESPEKYFKATKTLSANNAVRIEKPVGATVVVYNGPFFCEVDDTGSSTIKCRARFDDKVQPSEPAKDSFEDLKSRVAAEKNKRYFIPEVGDLVILDNWRVLHGRSQVLTTHKRKHRRIWISSLYPATGLCLGVRPIIQRSSGDLPRQQKVEPFEQSDVKSQIATYLRLSYDLLLAYRHAMDNKKPWPGENNWGKALEEDQLYNAIRIQLNPKIKNNQEILRLLDQLRSQDRVGSCFENLRKKIVSFGQYIDT